MKLTQARVARYLKKVKQINNYLLKVNTKDRNELVKLHKVRERLLEGEQELRELGEYLARGEN